MSENKDFRKKYLLPIAYCGVLAVALWSATGMISVIGPKSNGVSSFSNIEPASGDEGDGMLPAKVSESDLVNTPVVPAIPTDATQPATVDAAEEAPLRISSDKPEVIKLDRDAVNVLVGSDETLRAVPDTNRTIILIPKKPGATFFKAIDADGKVIMQRHVIVGAIEKGNKYIRIRRACAADDAKCKEFSVYYCPDMCHEVNVVQGSTAASSDTTRAPDVAPSSAPSNDGSEYVEPPVPTPAPTTAQ
jgi:Flp pilus assembly secretin CpaC